MALKKSLMVAAAVASIGVGGSALAASSVGATSGNDSIVDKLATRFNLDKNEVQKVFEEDRAQHKAKHHERMEDRLSQAVTDGKLTSEQKAKILAKLEELKASHINPEEMDSKTPEQHKAEMEQRHAELKQWAADNNIPEEYLPLRMKVRFHGGPDGPGGERGEVKMLEMHAD